MFFLFIYNFLNDYIRKGLAFHRLFLLRFFWFRQPVRTEWKERENYTLLLLYNLIYKKAFFYEQTTITSSLVWVQDIYILTLHAHTSIPLKKIIIQNDP